MIEVWEHLDCETVGARELEAIAGAVRERFGEGAEESPAIVARLLADEGAELRHAEVLEMDARWRSADPYEAMFRNVLKFSNFDEAAASIKRLDNLRRQFKRKKDAEGLRRVQETVLKGKQRAQMIARNASVNERKRAEKEEIAEWFTVWLRQPEIFEDWLHLRRRAKEFRDRFGD
jgi:ATP phosphoribosyltransferase regulatory subunit HisZ